MKEKNHKEIAYANIQVSKIHDFLTRFLEFDDNLLLEINSEEFYAKTYTADRSAIKYSGLPFEEVLQIKGEEEQEIPSSLKIGLINIKQYQQALKFFNSDEQVSMTVQYLNLAGLDDLDDDVAIKTTINNNKDLKFSFQNGSLSIYGNINNDKFFNEIANTEPIEQNDPNGSEEMIEIEQKDFEFTLKLEDLIKIKKYINIDKVESNLEIKFDGKSVNFGNNSFKYKLSSDDENGKNKSKASFPKDYLAMLDSETYFVSVCKSKIVFNSKDSKTIVVVGRNDA
jgi:hypothetical protein